MRSETNYPLTGQEANVLYTITGAQLMFIEVDSNTVSGKGAAGKGTGKGGGFNYGKGGGKGGQGHPPGAPPGTSIV